MSTLSVRALTAAAALMVGVPFDVASAAVCRNLSVARQPKAVVNENRAPGGTLRDGVFRLDLVARAVSWYPDGPDGCSIPVHAFAERGKSAQVPGPLVRVRAGTDVRVTVHNSLDTSIWVRGL